MSAFTQRQLGKTGLLVGPLGVAGGYGAPAEAFEAAFERGCNYFYWSTPRKSGMRQAIRNICRQGHREKLVVVLQSYSRSARLMELFFEKGLQSANLDHADVLLLGWYNNPPSRRILDKALAMQEKGLFRFLGLSGHRRSLFARLAAQDLIDIFHIRYNAAHRGAETEVFARLDPHKRPGTVTYTTTRWGQLLSPRRMPAGETPASPSDCYRFVLSHPRVDVGMCGPKNLEQMKAALDTLELGPMSPGELERMHKIGAYVHSKGKGG